MADNHVVTNHYCFNCWFARHYYRDFEFTEWRKIEKPQYGSNGSFAGSPRTDWQDNCCGERWEKK